MTETAPVVELADVDRAYARLENQAEIVERLQLQLIQAEAALPELEHEAITAHAIHDGLPLPEPGESAADWHARIAAK